MANEWIPIRCDLADDPAVVSIARATKLDPDAVVGKLHRLWSWAGSQSADGFVPGIDSKYVDEKVRKRGFAAAMAGTPISPWLEILGDGIRFPNFQRWLGSSSKSRMANTLRQQKARHRRDTGATSESEKARPQDSTGQDITIPPPPPAASNHNATLDPEWAAAEADLLRLGMLKAPDACRSARANGCSPMVVRNLAEYWRARIPAWDLGALFERIQRLRTGQDLSSLWPPESAKVARDVDQIASKKRQAAADEKWQDTKKQAENERARLQMLEEKWGSKLESMGREAVGSLAEKILPPNLRMLEAFRMPSKGIPGPGLLRTKLLEHLESMDRQAIGSVTPQPVSGRGD